jgi:fumarate reductase subunit D
MPYARSGFAKPQAQEAAMTGLILLVFLGVLVAFGWTRMRGKMKLGVTSKHWTAAIVIFVLVVLMMYAAHSGH